MNRPLRILFLLTPALATACVSSSIGADERHVRELTRIDEVARVAGASVEPETSDAARALLARPLDADAAARVALLNNRELRATLREIGVARGHYQQAGLFPNPVVEAELLPERESNLELRVEYDLTRAILAPMRRHAAAPDLEAARYRAADAVISLSHRARIAFYGVQAAQERLAIARLLLDAAAAGAEAARAMGEAGNVAELEVVGREAERARAEVAVAAIELELSSEREAVHRLLGLQGRETGFLVEGTLAEVPAAASVPASFERDALVASLRMRETKARLDGLQRRASVARTEGLLPDIAVDVHGLRHNDEPGARQDELERWGFGAGASLSVPLFDRRQGAANALDAEADALLERYYGAAVEVRSAAREARARLESAHARALQYQNVIVPAQRRVTEQTLLQYNAMQVGLYHLLQARRAELDVALARVEAARAYWTAVTEVDALRAGGQVGAQSRTTFNDPALSAARDQGGH